MMEKLLPQNIDAEESVLGSILIDPEAMDEVSSVLTSDDFYRDSHRTIYAAMVRLYAKRVPADLVTLSEALELENSLTDIGGLSYLVSLLNGVPTSLNAGHYARIVATKAEHRRRIHVAGHIAALSYEEADDAGPRAEQLLATVSGHGKAADFSPLSEVLLDCMADFDQMQNEPGSIVGVPTGYTGLDRMFGGLQPSDLLILAARPSVGKTTLAQNIAYNAMLAFEMRVAFFSLEMSKKQLAYRFIAMDSQVDSQRIRLGQINNEEREWDRIAHSIGVLSDGRLWIDDTAALDIDLMRTKIRRLHSQRQIDLVIVDYLQQMRATIDGKRPYSREQEVSEIARKLKQVARELNVPVLALAQLNRDSENHVVPQLSDLRESGQLEQEADIVMFLCRDEKIKNVLDIVVAKHRNGPVGTVRLGFEAKYTRFHNIDEQGREVAE